MAPNMGKLDRVIRIVLGIGLLGLYGALEPPVSYFTLLGLVLIGSALVGFCPLYKVLGISTGSRAA